MRNVVCKVADSMSPWLPSYPPRTEVVALEVEPSSGRPRGVQHHLVKSMTCSCNRYLSFLRPENCLSLGPAKGRVSTLLTWLG